MPNTQKATSVAIRCAKVPLTTTIQNLVCSYNVLICKLFEQSFLCVFCTNVKRLGPNFWLLHAKATVEDVFRFLKHSCFSNPREFNFLDLTLPNY